MPARAGQLYQCTSADTGVSTRVKARNETRVETTPPSRLRGWAGTFSTRIKARPLGAQPVAARADSSCLRPVVVSARAGQAADGAMNLGRKGNASGRPPSGKLHGQAADSRWWRVNSDLPLARHPMGCQTPADTSRRRACLDAPTTARQNRSLPTEGKIRAAPPCGLQRKTKRSVTGCRLVLPAARLSAVA